MTNCGYLSGRAVTVSKVKISEASRALPVTAWRGSACGGRRSALG